MTLFKMGLVDSSGCDRCKPASDMVTHILYDWGGTSSIKIYAPGPSFL